MAREFIPIVIFAIFVGGMVITIAVLTHLVGPRRPGAVKNMPYESGIDPVGDARLRFSVKFYIIAMLFILFDVEIAFFYPWAVVFRKFLPLGAFIFLELVVFIAILLAGFAYAWKKGALEWE